MTTTNTTRDASVGEVYVVSLWRQKTKNETKRSVTHWRRMNRESGQTDRTRCAPFSRVTSMTTVSMATSLPSIHRTREKRLEKLKQITDRWNTPRAWNEKAIIAIYHTPRVSGSTRQSAGEGWGGVEKCFSEGSFTPDVEANSKAIHLLLCVSSLNRNSECLLESICVLTMYMLRVLSLSLNSP